MNVIFLTAIALLLTGGFYGCGKKKNTQTNNVRFVKVEKVLEGNAEKAYAYNGKIKEKRELSLSFRVGGPLKVLNVKAGDFVKKGTVVAMIDQRDYKLQVQSAKAAYFQAKAEYERYKKLYEKKKFPVNTLDKLEAAYLMAKTGYENALNALNDTELKAPVSGYVHEKFVENFETVRPAQPVLSIVDRGRLEVMINVPESHLKNLENCLEGWCAVKNASVHTYKVTRISTGEKAGKDDLFEVRFAFDGKTDAAIRPGMSAEVVMKYSTDHNEGVSVPVEAVFYTENRPCVWVLNPTGSIVEKRAITVKELKSNGRIAIQSGVKTGETIVTAGVHQLSENQEVKPLQKQSETNVGGLL